MITTCSMHLRHTDVIIPRVGSDKEKELCWLIVSDDVNRSQIVIYGLENQLLLIARAINEAFPQAPEQPT